MSHRPPARGVVAGIREDARRAQEGGGAYDPRGVGVAWSHGFLNQKPWHPSSFRNQQRKFEAEARAMEKAKRIEEGKKEFESEQEHFRSLSYMSVDAQKKYQDRQSLAFMYMKPPGLEAALRKEQDAVKKKEKQDQKPQGEAQKTMPGTTSASVVRPMGPATFSDKGPVKTMLQGCALREEGEQSVQMLTRAAPYGGFDSTADNQQLVVGMDDLEEGPQESAETDAKKLRRLKKARKKEKRKLEVAHARSVLEAAGYDVEALTEELERSRGASKRDRGRRKDKKSRRHRDTSRSLSPARLQDADAGDRDRRKRRREKGGRDSGRHREEMAQ
ncbi:unnamed protein product [Ostreobium quekettii]|uniref:CBF1-interacting co-repressor CIR N-terminal domain-containing protein n=1 Tax=Ostreobium quekettii TaxID=121088 RepID=A0A8S1JC06_9CHLO|nr:unnamed protein product [Ostreobium quekettii]|eukprot:evm.model.scf_379.10 EVM.evm.TU.scf_379.10   scf_379:70381-75255(+)